MFKTLAEIASRLTIGYVFIESGWGKFQHLDKVIEFFGSLGLPAAHLQAPAIAALEIICGVMVLVGFATRLAAFLLCGVMVVALITAKRDDVHSISDLLGTIEFLYLVILSGLFAHGAKRFAVRPSA
jgi:putative oxidoreductase